MNILCIFVYHIFIASFRELGPPDLCHIIKSNNKVSTRDVHITIYFYILIFYYNRYITNYKFYIIYHKL